MGRLTLNILLSFAQFEREVIGERIRDKFAASRRKGMWMGGNVPLGYDVKDRKLVINPAEATKVRLVFERFAKVQSGTKLATEFYQQQLKTKTGKVFDKGAIYKLLNNRIYIGEAVHKGESFAGEHKPIISRTLWEKVHAILQESPRQRGQHSRRQTPALLKGLIFVGATGSALSPTHTRKGGKLYRYYISQDMLKGSDAATNTCPIRRVPAAEIETAVMDQLRQLLRSPEVVAGTWKAAQGHLGEVNGKAVSPGNRDREAGSDGHIANTAPSKSEQPLTQDAIRRALQKFDPLWNELFPAEQARIVQLLVERVDVFPDGIDIKLRVDGIASLVTEMREPAPVDDKVRSSGKAQQEGLSRPRRAA